MTRLELIGRLLLEFGEGEFTREGLVRIRGETFGTPEPLLLYHLIQAGVLVERKEKPRDELIYKLTHKAIAAFEKGEEP